MKRFFIFFLFFLSCISCFAQEDIWNPTPQLPNNYIGPNKLKNIYLSAGPTIEPTFIDHGSGVITVNACCISLFDNANHIGLPKHYDFTPATFTLTVDTTNYIVGNYNNGNPIIQCITDVDLINESNIVPVLTIYNKGGYLHSLNWDTIGKGLTNKLHQRLVKTERYKRESGLALSMLSPGTNLTFAISEGKVWYGATRESILAHNSTTDVVELVMPNGTVSTITALNNLNYVSDNTLQTLTANRYAVNWVYRGIEFEKHCYIMLGSGDYSLNDAQTAQPPAAPALINSHAQLIAKVIIQKSSTTVLSIQSAYDTQFALATPQAHNDLTGINDGDSFEHLTAIEKSQALVGSSSVDWAGKAITVFDSIKNATGTAAAPAYSFASDPNTGIYLPAADTLEFVVAGVPVATISSTGITGIADSSVTNDKLAEPVAIEKGGTGATTAAAGLAALGGASLNGSSTVPFNASIYNNADGDIADLVAMANGFNPRRWGIKIAKATGDPDARVEYLYDAVGMTPAAMNYTSGEFEYGDWKPFCDAMNRPVMLNPDGTVAYELDKNNQTLKRDGTASGISSTTHSLNAMSEFKRLWLRTYEDTDYQYIIFSNVQYDPNYRADAFTDASGNIRDRMYYAMFEGSYVAPRLRSLATGTVMTSQAGQVEIERAEANGAGWHINYKSQRDLITYLLWLISKSTYDMQKFGNGNSSSAAFVAPGALKSAGQFMGYNTTAQAVKTFYIENYWGNYWKRMSGLMLALDGEVRTKLTPPYAQPATPGENIMPAGYANTGIVPSGTSGTHLKNAATTAAGGFVPAITGAAGNTYFTCGYWWSIGTTIKWALVGGNLSHAGLCGAGTVSLDNPLSTPDSTLGAALSFLKYAVYGQ